MYELFFLFTIKMSYTYIHEFDFFSLVFAFVLPLTGNPGLPHLQLFVAFKCLLTDELRLLVSYWVDIPALFNGHVCHGLWGKSGEQVEILFIGGFNTVIQAFHAIGVMSATSGSFNSTRVSVWILQKQKKDSFQWVVWLYVVSIFISTASWPESMGVLWHRISTVVISVNSWKMTSSKVYGILPVMFWRLSQA